jgi:hypothetical protein
MRSPAVVDRVRKKRDADEPSPRFPQPIVDYRGHAPSARSPAASRQGVA